MGDLFDSTVQLEEQFIQEGVSEGVKAGRRSGLLEGQQLGAHKGFEVGQEVGFYWGCVQTWRAAQRQKPDFLNERVERGVAAIESMISRFPRSPQDETLQDAMAELRGKFKAIVTMMSLNNVYFAEGPYLESTGY